MEPIYKAAEISRLAGFAKPWMLGHLEREGIFVRTYSEQRRHGNVRKYTFMDLLILRAINRMLSLGMRPARIKSVVAKLADAKGFLDNREAMELLVQTLGVRLFVTQNDAHLVTSDDDILSLTKDGQLAFAFMVDLKESIGEVINIARAYEAKRIGNLKIDVPILDRMCTASGI